jgi:hypothetical protein
MFPLRVYLAVAGTNSVMILLHVDNLNPDVLHSPPLLLPLCCLEVCRAGSGTMNVVADMARHAVCYCSATCRDGYVFTMLRADDEDGGVTSQEWVQGALRKAMAMGVGM